MPIPIIRAQVTGLKVAQVRTNIIDIDEFSTTSFQNQTELVFPTGKSFTPGTKSVFIFIDGKLLPNSKYSETAMNVITFNFPLADGLEIVARWFRYNPSEPATSGNIIASEQEPDATKKVPGLLWLKPSTKQIKIFVDGKFEDLALKSDVDTVATSPDLRNDRLFGGTF